jgi:hypothetical protein
MQQKIKSITGKMEETKLETPDEIEESKDS